MFSEIQLDMYLRIYISKPLAEKNDCQSYRLLGYTFLSFSNLI